MNFHIDSQAISASKKTVSHTSVFRCIVCMRHREGRLGNRMFMVASAYGLARLNNCYLYLAEEVVNELRKIFILDLSLFILPDKLNSLIDNSSQLLGKIQKNVGCQYLSEMKRPNAIPQGSIFEITGYWQSYLHFTKYSNELRENVFAGTESIVDHISQLFVQLYEQRTGVRGNFSTKNFTQLKKQLTEAHDITWVGVHIRRSDFLEMNYTSSSEYIFSAIDYFTNRYPKAYFIAASDDKAYCAKLFHNLSNIVITPSLYSAGDDLITLSLCEHSIITAGSFGWWSAYLANGEVMHDKIYPSSCKQPEQYYPPWFLIDRL